MQSNELSSSPVSIFNLVNVFRERNKADTGSSDEKITLHTFLDRLPGVIDDTLLERASLSPEGALDDPISSLFSRLDLSDEDIMKCEHWDTDKNYTRNLVSSDGKRYTLLLLCWNTGRESPIHDHPCDGCWMRVCQGSVHECRYEQNVSTDRLDCFSDETYTEGQLAYITDSMGYHKVGNPSSSNPAITLHLYCPPFQSCKIWLNPESASGSSRCRVAYHSEYGRLTQGGK